MSRFSSWTNQQKAAQCVFPRLDINTFIDNITYKKFNYRDNIIELVKMGCGGFCIFGGDTNSVRKVITELQMYAEVPLLFCADFENGLQMRLSDGTSFPHHYALGKTTNYTNLIANAIAKESKNIGVDFNLAPVCDINSNKKNPIINVRSFGENKDIVSKNVVEFINGLHQENVISCAKHFPGHGDTDIDSHTSIPVITKTLAELEQNEIVPFVDAINNGVRSIMLGHLIVKSFYDSNNKDIPISLSNDAVLYLRNKLNFKGLILTDALDMKGVTNIYGDDAPLLAFKSGVDIILMPENPMLAIEQIANTLNDNNYNNQIDESLERIYNEKRWCNLMPIYKTIEPNPKLFTDHLQLALKAAIQATEIYPKDANLLHKDLIPVDNAKCFSAFSITQTTKDIQSASRFFTMLAQATEGDCSFGYLDEKMTDEELNTMANEQDVLDSEFFLFHLYFKGQGYSKLATPDKINKIISTLSNGKKKIVLFFGDPYIADEISGDIKILAYSDSFASLASGIMLITDRKLA
ncbi:MAG: hypothetical protein FWG85_02265 [Bacteroidetes bacterium]|nr:hypothetical protein [Bacteroidota bacterium]